MRFTRTAAYSSLVIGFITSAALRAQESRDLNHINPKFLMSLDDVQKIHASKDSLGPARSGELRVGDLETFKPRPR